MTDFSNNHNVPSNSAQSPLPARTVVSLLVGGLLIVALAAGFSYITDSSVSLDTRNRAAVDADITCPPGSTPRESVQGWCSGDRGCRNIACFDDGGIQTTDWVESCTFCQSGTACRPLGDNNFQCVNTGEEGGECKAPCDFVQGPGAQLGTEYGVIHYCEQYSCSTANDGSSDTCAQRCDVNPKEQTNNPWAYSGPSENWTHNASALPKDPECYNRQIDWYSGNGAQFRGYKLQPATKFGADCQPTVTPSPSPSPSITPQSGTLSGKVYCSLNTQNDQNGIPNVPIIALDSAGNLLDSATTTDRWNTASHGTYGPLDILPRAGDLFAVRVARSVRGVEPTSDPAFRGAGTDFCGRVKHEVCPLAGLGDSSGFDFETTVVPTQTTASCSRDGSNHLNITWNMARDYQNNLIRNYVLRVNKDDAPDGFNQPADEWDPRPVGEGGNPNDYYVTVGLDFSTVGQCNESTGICTVSTTNINNGAPTNYIKTWQSGKYEIKVTAVSNYSEGSKGVPAEQAYDSVVELCSAATVVDTCGGGGETGEISCQEKRVYADNPRNTAGNYILTDEITSSERVQVGQTIVFVIYPQSQGTPSFSQYSISDPLPSYYQFVDAQAPCSYNSSDRTVRCLLSRNDLAPKAFRVRIVSEPATEMISNTATIAYPGGEESQCTVTRLFEGASQAPVCTDITSDTQDPRIGDTVRFTCAISDDTTSNVRYEFRAFLNGELMNVLLNPINGSNVSQPLAIERVGRYEVQCRVCQTPPGQQTVCQEWEAASTTAHR